MRQLLLFLATLGPVGYLRGGGTIVSLIMLTFWYTVAMRPLAMALITLLIIISSFFLIKKVAPYYTDPDPSCIVIDEIAGMSLALIGFTTWPTMLIAFFLFRFFDISKIGIVGRLQHLPGAAGILADDLVAGALANSLTHLCILSASLMGYHGA